MATDYWELLCAKASASHPTHRFGLRLFSSSFLNEMDLKVLFLRERVRHYMIFINAGHVACQDMVREKCYKNKFIVGRGLL